MGEMKKIDGLVVRRRGLFDEFARRVVVELETLLQQALQLVALDSGNITIDRRGMDQQRRGGNAQVAVAETTGRLIAAREVGDEILDGVEHPFLRAAIRAGGGMDATRCLERYCFTRKHAPFVPAEAGTQILRQSLGPLFRGDERR